jgi:hypothetical protein
VFCFPAWEKTNSRAAGPHPRAWNHEFIDLPEVKGQRQPTHSSETMKAIAAGSEGRERMLYVFLGATGLRFGKYGADTFSYF